MNVVTLKKTKKNVFKNIKPIKKLDNIKDLDVKNSGIKKASLEYNKLSKLSRGKPIDRLLFALNISDKGGDIFRVDYDSVGTICTTILSPDKILEIKDFLSNYPSEEVNSEFEGYFISHLIQNSYLAGYNNFNFEITNSDQSFTSYLEGSKKDPIIINIKENRTSSSGESVKHCIFNIKENYQGSLGMRAKHSTFNIDINHDGDVGSGAEHSTFNIGKNYEGYCGEDSKNCIFKSSNKETLESAFKDAEVKGDNKFYLIQPNGEEILYRK